MKLQEWNGWIRSWGRDRRSASRVGLAGGLAITLAVLVSPRIPFLGLNLQVGDVAPMDIRAPKEFLVQDAVATTAHRHEAEEAVLPVYDAEPNWIHGVDVRVSKVFAAMRRREPKDRSKWIGTVLGVDLSEPSLAALDRAGWSKGVELTVRSILRRFQGRWIVADPESLDRGSRGAITLWELGNKGQPREVVLTSVEKVLDLATARERAHAWVAQVLRGTPSDTVTAVGELVAQLLRPNLNLNVRETEARRERARRSVKPVLYQFKKGEMIVRVGERVSADQVHKLQAMTAELSKGGQGTLVVGGSLLFLLLLVTLGRFAQEGIRKFEGGLRDLTCLAALLAGSTGLVRLSAALISPFEGSFPGVSGEVLHYSIPVAAACMLVRLVLNSETALVFAVPSALLAGIVLDWNLNLALYTFIVSIVGAFAVRHAERRGRILRAGVAVGLWGACAAFALEVIHEGSWGRGPLAAAVAGFLGGLGSGFLTTAVVPVVESLFDYVTDVSLLELASMDHPALRALVLKAPGTYHHSIMVGNLVEAAAQSIHANPLLARVGAYYHDLGKSAHPDYFVENTQGKNLHEALSPRMSRLVIESHIREGIELGRHWKIPQVILDFIPQHHGTGLIRYFYDKALREGQGTPEEEFRYPGPRPQSRETAIVMLADQVEAASRAMQEPTPAQIENMVRRIVDFNFTDGQLDECNLTLRDLHRISASFVRTLNVFSHRRVEYPPFSGPRGPLSVVGTTYAGPSESTEGAAVGPAERDPEGRGSHPSSARSR